MTPLSSAPPPSIPQEVRIFRGLFLFGLVLFAAWLAYLTRAVLVPFFLAGVLAYVTSPLVTFLELRGLRRSTAVAALYAVVIAATALLAWWIFSIWWEELPRFRYRWPLYLQQIKAAASQADAFLAAEWPVIAERFSAARGLDGALAKAQGAVAQAPAHALPVLAVLGLNLVLVPFVGFYFLKGGRSGFQAMLDACPGRWVEKFLSLLYKVDDVIGGYLRGVLLEALLIGSCAGLALLALGVEYAGFLGAAAMVFNVVPYFGPMAAGALAAVAAFLQFGTLTPVGQVLLVFLSLRLLDDFVFQPMVMNRAVHLHPALVVFALLAGHEAAGVWGLILAVPVVSIAKETTAVLLAWYRSEAGRNAMPPALARAAAKPWVV